MSDGVGFGSGVFLSEVLSRVPGVEHGFGGLVEPMPLRRDWESRRVQWKQVHGVGVASVSRSGQACGDVDALFSRAVDVPVSVVTADCVPVLLARRDGSCVAAVHAGWRGTRAGILRSLWEHLALDGERASDWVAAVGPSIGPCCYEVSEELASDFAGAFAAFGAGVVPRFRHLDLPYVNACELRAIGVGEVDLLRLCTRCSVGTDGAPLFHSYRREGGGVRQYSMIQRVR